MFQTPKEVFDQKIGPKIQKTPELVASIEGVVVMHITGENGGDWSLDCAQNPPALKTGALSDPKVEMTMTAADFVAMANGSLNPQMAFLGGKLKVKGNMGLALKLGAVLT